MAPRCSWWSVGSEACKAEGKGGDEEAAQPLTALGLDDSQALQLLDLDDRTLSPAVRSLRRTFHLFLWATLVLCVGELWLDSRVALRGWSGDPWTRVLEAGSARPRAGARRTPPRPLVLGLLTVDWIWQAAYYALALGSSRSKSILRHELLNMLAVLGFVSAMMLAYAGFFNPLRVFFRCVNHFLSKSVYEQLVKFLLLFL